MFSCSGKLYNFLLRRFTMFAGCNTENGKRYVVFTATFCTCTSFGARHIRLRQANTAIDTICLRRTQGCSCTSPLTRSYRLFHHRRPETFLRSLSCGTNRMENMPVILLSPCTPIQAPKTTRKKLWDGTCPVSCNYSLTT